MVGDQFVEVGASGRLAMGESHVCKGCVMKKLQKQARSASGHSKEIGKVGRSGSEAKTASAAGVVRGVSPTSERIIKETSIKRRTAMTVLANR